MFKSDKPFHFEIDPEFDFVLEEKGNTYTALRKIKWGDKENYSLDLRKYYATEKGEQMAKGCSLMTKEGADELTKVLIMQGYGNDKSLADDICNNRVELAARIYDNIQNNQNLKNTVEDIIVNHLSEEDDEYFDLDEVI